MGKLSAKDTDTEDMFFVIMFLITLSASATLFLHFSSFFFKSPILWCFFARGLPFCDVLQQRFAERGKTSAGRNGLPLRKDEQPLRPDLLCRWIALIFLVSIPLTSWSLYAVRGSPGFLEQPLANRLEKDFERSTLEELLGRAENVLLKRPDDWKGWDAVAPVYLKTGRFAEAVRAYENAIRLDGSNAIRQAGRGEALVYHAQGFVSPEAEQSFEKALSQMPGFEKALFFLGLAKSQKGQKLESLKIWKELLTSKHKKTIWKDAAKRIIHDYSLKENPAPFQAKNPGEENSPFREK